MEYLSLFADVPGLRVWYDISTGLFYAATAVLWLLFVGEHRMVRVKHCYSIKWVQTTNLCIRRMFSISGQHNQRYNFPLLGSGSKKQILKLLERDNSNQCVRVCHVLIRCNWEGTTNSGPLPFYLVHRDGGNYCPNSTDSVSWVCWLLPSRSYLLDDKSCYQYEQETSELGRWRLRYGKYF